MTKSGTMTHTQYQRIESYIEKNNFISRTIHGNTQMTTTYFIKYFEAWSGCLCCWY